MENVKTFVNKSGRALELERFDNGSVSVLIRVPVPGSEGCFDESIFFLEGKEVREAMVFLNETLYGK